MGKAGGGGAVQCIHMLGVTHLVQCNGMFILFVCCLISGVCLCTNMTVCRLATSGP